MKSLRCLMMTPIFLGGTVEMQGSMSERRVQQVCCNEPWDLVFVFTMAELIQ